MPQSVPSDVRNADRPEHAAAARSSERADAHAIDGDGAARVILWAHAVQFYDDLSVLAVDLADFLAPGLAAGESAIVMASAPCRAALERELTARGFDTALAATEGRMVLADAREALASFMVDGMPDRERFEAVVGGLLDSSLEASVQPRVRVFGEMVDLLWKDGRAEAAIRLEQLWNELALSRPFSLVCAYEMSGFPRAEDTADFRRICGEHEHVVPAGGFTRASDAMRLREISILQQRARALEFEIEQRKELERRLRSALAEREKAEERARAASMAKSEFLAVMSHELRTPLNAIGGHIQLIELGLHGPVTPAQRAALARAQANQRHLLSLINDVLNLVRIETGRLEYRMELVELPKFLTNVVSMIEPLLAEKQLEWRISFASDELAAEGTMYADVEKAQQIMLNLLTNSMKFTPAHGRVEVIGRACADPRMLQIQVRDTGIGIPASKLAQVFDPFVQAAPVHTGHRDGVGLGLAISRDLARGMGGDLTVESVVGEGTTMTLTLPRSAPSAR